MYKVHKSIGFTSVFFILLVLTTASKSQDSPWTTKKSMPTPRIWAASCQVDGIIYVIGGLTKTSLQRGVRAVEAYDPATNTWAKKASMSEPRLCLVACSVNGKIYAIGGDFDANYTKPTDVVEEYDPKTDTWQTKTPLPVKRGYLTGATIGDKIYVFGGGVSVTGAKYDVFCYDTINDTWTKKMRLPTARANLHACAVNGHVYVLGGASFIGGIGDLLVNEVYDPITDTWTIKKDMPDNHLAMAESAIGNKIYTFGGAYPIGCGCVWIYDTVNDSWATGTTMPTKRLLHTACTVNGKIYVIGGEKEHYFSGIMGTVEVYDPALDPSTKVMEDFTDKSLENFSLCSNYPNPFNPSTTIKYTLPQPGRVTVSIYNLFGQHVQTLVDEEQNAGVHTRTWNATDEEGHRVSSGVYLYRIEIIDNLGREAWRAERKMVLLK
jgi:N-acetylneuraminic acid mutarotase